VNAKQGIGRYVINVTDLLCRWRHDLSAEFGPISDGCRTELMLSLDSVNRNAASDVREEQNLHKVQVTLLKPSTVAN